MHLRSLAGHVFDALERRHNVRRIHTARASAVDQGVDARKAKKRQLLPPPERQQVAVVLQQDGGDGREAPRRGDRCRAGDIVLELLPTPCRGRHVHDANVEQRSQDAGSCCVDRSFVDDPCAQALADELRREVVAPRHLHVEAGHDRGRVRGTPVRHHEPIETKQPLELLRQDGRILAGPDPVHLVVAAHEGAHFRFYRPLKRRVVHLEAHTLVGFGAHKHAISLLTVQDEVLGVGDDLLRLDATNRWLRQRVSKEGVLT
mmetsp:Transcript_5858/g.15612  ORF Transcript_5858/g.15612 Transcript_5858/m.15612 type:complete len:260 (+) Transcript_5858:1125-1904(+)